MANEPSTVPPVTAEQARELLETGNCPPWWNVEDAAPDLAATVIALHARLEAVRAALLRGGQNAETRWRDALATLDREGE